MRSALTNRSLSPLSKFVYGLPNTSSNFLRSSNLSIQPSTTPLLRPYRYFNDLGHNLSHNFTTYTSANERKDGNNPPNKTPYILAIIASITAAGFIAKMYVIKNEMQAKELALVKLVLNTVKEDFSHMLPKGVVDSEDWRHLEQNGFIYKIGDDKELRPIFVNLQGAIEAAILLLHQQGKINLIMHATHTDLPSSPICEIGPNDMHPDIASDPKRRETVYNRTVIMANMLKADIPVEVIYSEGGLLQRSPEAQQRYKDNVTQYSNLDSHELGEKVRTEESGATAIAASEGSPQQSKIFFSISAAQAIKLGSSWGLCLDGVSKPRSSYTAKLLEERRGFSQRHQLDNLVSALSL